MKLPIYPQYFLPCLGDLEIYPIFVFAQLGLERRGAVDFRRSVVLPLEHGGDTQALSVEQDDGLPVIELEELGRKGRARFLLGRGGILPLVESPVNVDPPRAERIKVDQERRRQVGVHI